MIVVMSLWRNDADRNLRERALHLLSKSSAAHTTLYLWAVGDCDDDTWLKLSEIVEEHVDTHDIILLGADTGLVGEDVDTRRMRSSATATRMFDFLKLYSDEAEYVLLHESDLQSPPDVIDQLLKGGGGNPCAGWPIIKLNGDTLFYDTWAYKYISGGYFFAESPRPQLPFPVHGFGSVWVAPTRFVAGRVLKRFAIRELCEQWREERIPMFCDPRVIIEQPTSLWSPS